MIRIVTSDAGKHAAATAAVGEVVDGMRVGLGTGATMAFVIAALSELVRNGLQIEVIATSLATADAAARAGLRVIDFGVLDRVDLGLDGADEIDPQCRAIKGLGGAMLREKIVATSSARMVAVVDDSKLVQRLGRGPLPVEVLPFALTAVSHAIERLAATVVERQTPSGPYRTDQGNAVLDCHFASLDTPEQTAVTLSVIPGVLGHGLFLTEIDAAYIGGADGAYCRERTADTPAAEGAR